MKFRPKGAALRWAVLALSVFAGGCVERRFVVRSDPPGARVFLDGEDVGLSPTEVSFLHYGARRVVLRLDGYRTREEIALLPRPYWQTFPLDFFTDLLIPWTIEDVHEAGPYALEKVPGFEPGEGGAEALLERARAARAQLGADGPDVPK